MKHSTAPEALTSETSALEPQAVLPPVGGQAVMEGILMRYEGAYALAVRRPDGSLVVERHSWRRMVRKEGKIFLRGFPILVETLMNGIQALSRSAQLSGEDEEALSPAQTAFTLIVAFALAVGMFIVLPHGLSGLMTMWGLGGGMDGLLFHIWDGVYKIAIFLAYVAAISLLPDIRRVFQYHGAEHKVIGAFEQGGDVSVDTASLHSRLHPRCGTTFLLFVLTLAIVLHVVLIPGLLWLMGDQIPLVRHGVVLGFKIILIVPISGLAYELIRLGTRLGESLPGRILRAPGLGLQMLTTREPDDDQLEVAVAALREALGDEWAGRFSALPAYTVNVVE